MARLVSALPATVAVLALSALAGCGSANNAATDPAATSDTTATTPAGPTTTPPPALPDCAGVWVAGKTLPRTYKGCLQDGTAIAAKKHPCSFGSTIIEFDNQFYAIAGKAINEMPDLASSAQFHQALTSCQA